MFYDNMFSYNYSCWSIAWRKIRSHATFFALDSNFVDNNAIVKLLIMFSYVFTCDYATMRFT